MEIPKKVIWDVVVFAVCMLILAAFYPVIARRSAERSAEDFWTAERKANARRLFGEAWDE